MPGRALQALEGDFEDETLIGLVHNLTHRTEALGGVAADEAVDLQQLLVGKAEIGFATGTSSSPACPLVQTPNV